MYVLSLHCLPWSARAAPTFQFPDKKAAAGARNRIDRARVGKRDNSSKVRTKEFRSDQSRASRRRGLNCVWRYTIIRARAAPRLAVASGVNILVGVTGKG